MKRDNISIIKKKLRSMRYSKKDVQSETSQDAKQFMYGYTECINDLLEYLTSGKDGLPEHELLADEPAGQRCVDCPANQFYLANTEKIMNEQDKEHSQKSKPSDAKDRSGQQPKGAEKIQKEMVKDCQNTISIFNTQKYILNNHAIGAMEYHKEFAKTNFKYANMNKEKGVEEVAKIVWEKNGLHSYTYMQAAIDVAEQYHKSQVRDELNNSAMKFYKKYHGILNQGDIQSIAKFIDEYLSKHNS